MGLYDATSTKTAADYGTLPKDVDGDCCNADFNYASIVGMLLYLLGHSRPELAFSISQYARYTFSSKISREKVIKRIGRYLIGTRTKELIMKPFAELSIDCYVDSNFAGLWSHEDNQYPTCVCSRTGFLIMIGNCPTI